MKTRKHGQGMTHKQVIAFSNRLQAQARQDESVTDYLQGFDDGWAKACEYFAHELRKALRDYERINEI